MMQPSVDVAITATLRPALLKESLTSWRDNLWRDYAPLRGVVNIDPVGEPGATAADVLAVCREFFPDLICNVPAEGNHAAALRWAWANATAPYVLAIEDDWRLVLKRDLAEVVGIMATRSTLGFLRWNRYPVGPDSAKHGETLFPWNGDYFECPKDARRRRGFVTAPNIMSLGFVHDVVAVLPNDRQPEHWMQSCPPETHAIYDRWEFGTVGKPNDGPSVVDIGSDWLLRNGRRHEGGAAFIHWTANGAKT